MEITIYSRKLKQNLTYSRPGGGYIYVDLNGEPGFLVNQICYGGGLAGSTIAYDGEDFQEFEKICERWHRSFIKKY